VVSLGTRLLSEHLIQKRYPHLRYVRIHTNGKNSAAIYAWDGDLQLKDADARELKIYAASHLPPYVCFQVKPYSLIQLEKVPSIGDLPDSIRRAAMSRTLNLDGIVATVNGLFAGEVMSFRRYDLKEGKIHFDIRLFTPVTDIEKELLHKYLYELVPLGSGYEVAYRTQ
jgi:hypothetical protein